MSTQSEVIKDPASEKHQPPHRRRLVKMGKITAIVIGAVIFLVVILMGAATLWLTPDRLTRMVNETVSRELNADVTAHNVRFTIWSSFPHFCIDIDSVRVISRVLRKLPVSQRDSLPADCDYLASTGRLRGGINLLRLLKGEICLRDVEVEALDLNLVAADSLANYLIWTPDTTKSTIPYFTANRVSIVNPRRLRFFSLPSSSNTVVALDKLLLERHADNNDSYSLQLSGKVDSEVDKMIILRGFPVNLAGRIDLGFDPFRIRTSDYHVNLGEIKGNVSMAMEMGKEIKLNDFSYRLDNCSISRILSYLPPELAPNLERIDADVSVNATARLTSPYLFSSRSLPSAEVDFNIPPGKVGYNFTDGESYILHHGATEGKLLFNGSAPEKSHFDLSELELTGEGLALTVAGRVTDLLADPEVSIKLTGDADLNRAGRLISALRPYSPKGMLDTDALLRFRVSDVSKGDLASISLHGDVALKDFSMRRKGIVPGLSGDGVLLRFGGGVAELTDEILSGGLFDLTGRIDSLTIDQGKMKVRTQDMALESSVSSGAAKPLSQIVSQLPLDLKITSGRLAVEIPGDTIEADIRNLQLDGKMVTRRNDMVPSALTLRLKGDNVEFSLPDGKLSVNDISATFRALSGLKEIRTADYKAPAAWTADRMSIDRVGHTFEYLTVPLPARLKNLMARWRTYLDLNIGNGRILTRSFPVSNTFHNVRLAASFDSVVLRNLDLRSRSSAMSMSGSLSNLRQFLNSRTPAPLDIRLDVALDTVQINQLAGAYEKGLELTKGVAATQLKPMPAEVSPSDTIAMLIPRNIRADIRATAKRTEYMNLHFYNLSTGVKVADGDAKVENLKIYADFGHAEGDLAYSTSDVQRLGAKVDLSVRDINLVNFFKNFHTLLLMMPQMKNLQGTISADCDMSLLLFPNMYLNFPSVNADIFVEGRGLKVHQDEFIRHITKMMLIRTSDDLHIENMNVHASVHDNLLELYPFKFEFDRYRLSMGGLNNFDGDLYYHIGIDKSPVPFPFGVNIVGHFSHPEIRFGGAKYKVKKGTEITSSVMESKKMNVVRQMKYYMREFIHKAAESDTTINQHVQY